MSEIVYTKFREFRGVYERRKAEALVEHCRTLAGIANRAAVIRPYPEREWIVLQERVNPYRDYDPREGEWVSDIEVEWLS